MGQQDKRFGTVAVPEGNRRGAMASSPMARRVPDGNRWSAAGDWLPKGTDTRDVPYGTQHLVSDCFLEGTRCARQPQPRFPMGTAMLTLSKGRSLREPSDRVSRVTPL